MMITEYNSIDSVIPKEGLAGLVSAKLSFFMTMANDARHDKTDLKVFVIVIPK